MDFLFFLFTLFYLPDRQRNTSGGLGGLCPALDIFRLMMTILLNLIANRYVHDTIFYLRLGNAMITKILTLKSTRLQKLDTLKAHVSFFLNSVFVQSP